MGRPDFEELEVYKLAESLANQIWDIVKKWDYMMSGSITIIKPPLGATNGSLSNLELSLAVGVIVGSD